jgi:hypothetical protein
LTEGHKGITVLNLWSTQSATHNINSQKQKHYRLSSNI